MALFFFRTSDDGEDVEGIELPDASAARAEAISAAADILRDLAGDLTNAEWRMDVRDEDGRTLITVRFSTEAPQSVARLTD